MKKAILVSAIALFSTSVMALDADSSATAITGSYATSAGNGSAFQSTGAQAWNQSSANQSNQTTGSYQYPNAFAVQSTVHTDATTIGGTSTQSYGVQSGNASNIGGAYANQTGSASAQTGAQNYKGYTDVNSNVVVKSTSLSANINNGWTDNGTYVGATNASNGSVGGTTTGWYPVVGSTSNASSDTAGATVSQSYDYKVGAFGVTGGSATQFGIAQSVAP